GGSTLSALSRLGARVRRGAPRTMLPAAVEKLVPGVSVATRLEQALEGADVVMMLRIQKERLGSVGLFPNTREYSRYFGLSARTLAWAKPDAIVMHPGPINRGVEMDPAVAVGERAGVVEQTACCAAIRVAV